MSNTTTCPFLGPDDGDGRHVCLAHSDNRIIISPRYVESYCLTPRHIACELFRDASGAMAERSVPPGSEAEETAVPQWLTGEDYVDIRRDVIAPQGPDDAPEPVPAEAPLPVDADQPGPPAPIIVSPTNGTVIHEIEVTLSGTAQPYVTVKIYDWLSPAGEAEAGDDGSWTASLQEIEPGEHMYVAQAVDLSGARSPQSLPVTVSIGLGGGRRVESDSRRTRLGGRLRGLRPARKDAAWSEEPETNSEWERFLATRSTSAGDTLVLPESAESALEPEHDVPPVPAATPESELPPDAPSDTPPHLAGTEDARDETPQISTAPQMAEPDLGVPPPKVEPPPVPAPETSIEPPGSVQEPTVSETEEPEPPSPEPAEPLAAPVAEVRMEEPPPSPEGETQEAMPPEEPIEPAITSRTAISEPRVVVADVEKRPPDAQMEPPPIESSTGVRPPPPGPRYVSPLRPPEPVPASAGGTVDIEQASARRSSKVTLKTVLLAAIVAAIAAAGVAVGLTQLHRTASAPATTVPTAPAPAPDWSFPPAPAGSSQVFLTLSNPGSRSSTVTIRTTGPRSSLIRSIQLAPHGGAELELTSPLFARPLTISAAGPIVSGRIISRSSGVRFSYGRPSSGGAHAGQP
ncbi:MAG TPA: hypothetical protein VF221_15865 [Chloroflexota bacterium]